MARNEAFQLWRCSKNSEYPSQPIVDSVLCFVQAYALRSLLEIQAWLNTLIHDQVAELAARFPTARYCIDGTAEGGKEALGYFRRAGLDVMGVDFSKAKQTILITLKNSMQQGLFQFADDKLRAQLGSYKFKESDSTKGKYKFGQPGVPDDRVDAAALACYRAFLLRGYGGADNAVIFVGGAGQENGPPFT